MMMRKRGGPEHGCGNVAREGRWSAVSCRCIFRGREGVGNEHPSTKYRERISRLNALPCGERPSIPNSIDFGFDRPHSVRRLFSSLCQLII
jgi:hypothetical protein